MLRKIAYGTKNFRGSEQTFVYTAKMKLFGNSYSPYAFLDHRYAKEQAPQLACSRHSQLPLSRQRGAMRRLKYALKCNTMS